MQLEDVTELLPDIVQDMIRLIGFADTEKMIKTFGGVTFRFTDGVVYFPKLVELIGRDKAIKLREFFRCEHAYIPRCEVALRMLRNYNFKSDYDRLTQIERKSGRQAMLELCPKYQISDRLGWSLIKDMQPSATQSALF
ncbi:mor transcription activator family protein [Caviibacterium pharyngocola]|uniref:Mor transcription activator family protein n=1 Tax=Caviibacterium pharyngocola TaxID=28159 RepID=A0A2M8RY22_9PAST|nr:mor transcription activator family protein [Caviibacterium pharyngocola]PJG83784.1 mor transcription activator family protein [Caviibacterium pharyngocola]